MGDGRNLGAIKRSNLPKETNQFQTKSENLTDKEKKIKETCQSLLKEMKNPFWGDYLFKPEIFLTKIDESKITDPRTIYKILKILLKNNEFLYIYKLGKCINEYGLDVDLRYKIAKITAVKYVTETSTSIQHYGFKDEEKLFEIAKIAAAQNGEETSKYISHYGIKDQQKLTEIAKIAAAQNVRGTSQYIKEY